MIPLRKSGVQLLNIIVELYIIRVFRKCLRNKKTQMFWVEKLIFHENLLIKFQR